MAGIWERIRHTAEVDRVPVHLLDAVITGYANGTMNASQVLSAVNSVLENPLAAAAVADLVAIETVIGGFGSSNRGRISKLEYTDKFRYATVAAESGVISEAQFRSALGIA